MRHKNARAGQAGAKAPWSLGIDEVLSALGTQAVGLSGSEAKTRLASSGPNEIKRDGNHPAWRIFFRQFTSPLVMILIGASLISFALGERAQTVIILAMMLLGGVLAFVQEYRSERSLRLLRKKLTRYANVIRDGKTERLDARYLVPGDVVELDLGNVVPADLRLIKVEDLEIDESSITGESNPVAKVVQALPTSSRLPQEQTNIAFLGTNVVQGSGVGIVVRTGAKTEFGRTAALLTTKQEETEFQKGIREFGGFLVKVTLGLVVVVFIFLALLRGEYAESLLFALALAVGVSPELLPLIVTMNLSRGAIAMGKKSVLVKRLISIEDLGNADVFCTDKTGTLTVGRLRLRSSLDIMGQANDLPLMLAMRCLETKGNGQATNPIDTALLESAGAERLAEYLPDCRQIDVISFDFKRRRMSCVLERGQADRFLVTKGAIAEVIEACSSYLDPLTEKSLPLDGFARSVILGRLDSFHRTGQRVIAVARKNLEAKVEYSPDDESDLELIGFVTVSDAPKTTAKAALQSLAELGTRIVVLTGDNQDAARYIAGQIGFEIHGIMTGDDLEKLDDAQLEAAVEQTNVFARITPEHKLRVIRALKKRGHTVGFMGDGVNDAPALRAADVGISFDDASDVAKEAAGIILLKKNLSVLADGIREGRKTFVNTRTYIYATISSNFGNMLSVAGASLFLPFIPLLPAQILLLNLVSDLPMLAITTDSVADSELKKPKHWNIQSISNFMYFFGTISSLADYATFGILLLVVNADMHLFRSGWFIESMLTEVVIIFMVRSRVLSRKNLPSKALIFSSLAIVAGTVWLVESGAGAAFGLVPLGIWLQLAMLAIVAGYSVLTLSGKLAYYRYLARAAE
jgi:Mg2+-importing ATPase